MLLLFLPWKPSFYLTVHFPLKCKEKTQNFVCLLKQVVNPYIYYLSIWFKLKAQFSHEANRVNSIIFFEYQRWVELFADVCCGLDASWVSKCLLYCQVVTDTEIANPGTP